MAKESKKWKKWWCSQSVQQGKWKTNSYAHRLRWSYCKYRWLPHLSFASKLWAEPFFFPHLLWNLAPSLAPCPFLASSFHLSPVACCCVSLSLFILKSFPWSFFWLWSQRILSLSPGSFLTRLGRLLTISEWGCCGGEVKCNESVHSSQC